MNKAIDYLESYICVGDEIEVTGTVRKITDEFGKEHYVMVGTEKHPLYITDQLS